MPSKTAYIERLKDLYRQKNGTDISDDDALECFERLVALVSSITAHIRPEEITIPNHGE